MKKKKWERKTKGKKIKNKKPNRKFRGMGLERGVMGVGKGRQGSERKEEREMKEIKEK